MKAELLSVLRDADDYVSGQDLCEKFGVSRTAVWKGINQLKEAGYEIEAVPNKGYKLLSVPDTLSEEELKSIRKTAWVGQEIFYYSVIDSTNTRAKQLAEEDYPTGTLVVAGQQDAGRGRRGRSFESPQGAGIFMTLMLKPELSPVNAPMLTLVAALAVCAAIVKTTGRPAGIKWPNDIVMNGKKVCGILTEMSAQMDYVNHIVIGIGINVHNESFPEEIAPVATSLYMETGEHFNRAALIEEVWEQFEHYYAIFMETEDLSGLVKEYDAHLVNRNQIVKVLDPKEPFEGKAMGHHAAGRADRGYLGEQKTRIGGGGLRPGRLWIRVEGAARAASVETVWKGMSEMEEVVLCGASAYNKKFYLNEDFKGLPEQIKNELKIMCVLFTEDVGGIFQLVFSETGELEFRTSCDENDLLYDEIGCGLKIRQLQQTKQELLEALQMYYKVLYVGI